MPSRMTMTAITAAGSFRLGDRTVNRLGYGAMQLAGPGVFGPPKDRDAALAVLREAVASGVNHIDTSDFYGPHITNQLIREALHPYPHDLVIVTKVGAARGEDASWHPAMKPAELTRAVHDNLRNLGVDVLDVVNLRLMGDVHRPSEGSIEEPLTALAELQRQGLIRHLGLSNVRAAQVEQGRGIAEIVCVQNHYNLAQRDDDALIDHLAIEGIAYVPFFPLGGFTPLQSSTLSDVAARRDAAAGGAGLAAAARAQHPADPRHLVARPPAREPRGSRAIAVGGCARRTRHDRQDRSVGEPAMRRRSGRPRLSASYPRWNSSKSAWSWMIAPPGSMELTPRLDHSLGHYFGWRRARPAGDDWFSAR
jgi:pyridoxine 4-dehydrogenase